MHRRMLEPTGWLLVLAAVALGGCTPQTDTKPAATFNCGIGMAVVVARVNAASVSSALQGIEIGGIEPGSAGCTVSGAAGTWSSREDWSATHNA